MPNNIQNGECCTPAGCMTIVDGITSTDGSSSEDGGEIVKVLCNNEHCPTSGLMHRQCFDQWEASVLHYLRSCGRARSWSERQRSQNLWTKKGYDLAFKACGCLCGRGHLRKDCEWQPKKPLEVAAAVVVGENEQKNKQQRRKSATTIVKVGLQQQQQAVNVKPSSSAAQMMMNNQIRHRANSLSSTGSTTSSSGSSSPPEAVNSSSSSSAGASSAPVFVLSNNKNKRTSNDRERRGSGNSGLFVHRANFSSFNALPRHKLNSYHIKMEDEGSYGNDDIRCFILSNLATAKMSKTFCVVCQNAMQIYDRYPLIDGTFFLAPKQYSKACIPVTSEGRQQYLSAVCMSCLEGWTCTLRCRSCRTPWNGGSFILGTLYSYDVFAGTPCCPERLRCNQCNGLVVQPEQRFQNFSQYSRDLSCPHCASHDHHFVKPLPSVFQLFRSSGRDQHAIATPPTI
ncbi:hypothetical protein DAPPUDRAFT_325521 [Daphnia pulex]|uniref:Uncharacterized protein n=1 Tax=Daphnia pulex TaxID=6669 RepID=E9H4Z7_DAPPU|nr:hypothetical protein DAPPUDRAFT_325521 [Daphnia pulex]|eukprot:EFX73234.1 hypothetical protein DAPPUDRAFT_325521 [Daphnia pulex]